MGKDTDIHSADRMKIIADVLSKSVKVSKFDTKDEEEAWTLAHSFVDLNKSFNTFSNDLFPKLFKEGIETEEIEDILYDIGEEFRHILYHFLVVRPVPITHSAGRMHST